MSSPNRDSMHPGAGKLLDSSDQVFDETALLKSVVAYLAGGGIPVNPSSGGGTGGAGNSTYSNVSGDFTATANNGAKTITLSAYASTVLSAALDAKNIAGSAFFLVSTSGVVTKLPTTNVAFAANVITLSDMTANFVTTDKVLCFIPGPEKGYLQAGDVNKATLYDPTGTNGAAVITVGADGSDNTSNRLSVSDHLKGFNGTTWDRLRSGITAVTATLTGWLNTMPWALFHTTPSTRTDGQGGPLEADAKGNLSTTLGALIEGENQNLHRMMTMNAGKPTRITTATTTVCQNGAGGIIGILVESVLTGTVTIDDAVTATNTISILPIGTPAGYYPFPATVTVGATIVTSASDRIVVFTNP